MTKASKAIADLILAELQKAVAHGTPDAKQQTDLAAMRSMTAPATTREQAETVMDEARQRGAELTHSVWDFAREDTEDGGTTFVSNFFVASMSPNAVMSTWHDPLPPKAAGASVWDDPELGLQKADVNAIPALIKARRDINSWLGDDLLRPGAMRECLEGVVRECSK